MTYETLAKVELLEQILNEQINMLHQTVKKQQISPDQQLCHELLELNAYVLSRQIAIIKRLGIITEEEKEKLLIKYENEIMNIFQTQ